jgi:siroheme synthase-like protein
VRDSDVSDRDVSDRDQSHRHYMACIDLRGRSCLVVGGGSVALEKVGGLLECDAAITVVAPEVSAELRELPVCIVERRFEPSDVDGRLLVIAATDDRPVNEAVSRAAAERGILCNVADDPELCSFILPAIVRQDPILVGVSTGGASPALAQRLRRDIGELVGPEHAQLARRLEALRPWAKRTLPTYEERRDYFQALVAEELK